MSLKGSLFEFQEEYIIHGGEIPLSGIDDPFAQLLTNPSRYINMQRIPIDPGWLVRSLDVIMRFYLVSFACTYPGAKVIVSFKQIMFLFLRAYLVYVRRYLHGFSMLDIWEDRTNPF